MNAKQIYYKENVLNFYQMGHGSHVLLAFHGFGQNSKDFGTHLIPLSAYYTIYIFEHFFHGKSSWKPDNRETPLTKDDWQEILGCFFENENIEKCDILAYSIGGKLALATLEKYPEKLKRIFLIAPDGLKTNPWYYFATSNFMVRNWFKQIITKPGAYFILLKGLLKLKFINLSLKKFVTQQMDTKKKRWQVYHTWMLFRKLKFNLKTTGQILEVNEINLLVFLGKFDKIFPPPLMQRSLKSLPKTETHVINTGHNGILKLSIPEIINNIKSIK